MTKTENYYYIADTEKEVSMAKKYISIAETAKKLKVNEKVIQEMINTKVFETKLVGKNIKIDEASLN